MSHVKKVFHLSSCQYYCYNVGDLHATIFPWNTCIPVDLCWWMLAVHAGRKEGHSATLTHLSLSPSLSHSLFPSLCNFANTLCRSFVNGEHITLYKSFQPDKRNPNRIFWGLKMIAALKPNTYQYVHFVVKEPTSRLQNLTQFRTQYDITIKRDCCFQHYIRKNIPLRPLARLIFRLNKS